MLHLDLFSGIGGFALAVEEVWPDARHIFCDNDKYCQSVIKKHWPEAEVWSDIRDLIADAKRGGYVHREHEVQPAESRKQAQRKPFAGIPSPFILTGGFPCQPFSHAGKRRGKSDDRFLWPEMLECIRLFKPEWIIAENVYGILSIDRGMVFEQVCIDMEKAGYEVWPFIIPACAVNAPHRRDRVWFVANSDRKCSEEHKPRDKLRYERKEVPSGRRIHETNWETDWREIAARTCVCRMDDGLPGGLDGISNSKRRTERLKMLGNAIVPQVAVEIMRAIKENTA